MSLRNLKIVSIVVFLIITRNNNEHVVMPMVFILVTSAFYIVNELKAAILPFMASLGIVLVLMSELKKSKTILLLGYLLTYLILMRSFFDKTLYENVMKELFFFITSGFYIIMSIYILIKNYSSSNKNIPKE